MTKCLLCGRYYTAKLSFTSLFSISKCPEGGICLNCLSKFVQVSAQHCPICYGKAENNELCLDCRNWRQLYGNDLLSNQSVYLYNAAFHDLMVNYKRYGDYYLSYVLQILCSNQLNKIKADLYIPIPTSSEHIAKRQFDTISAIYDNLVPLTHMLSKISGFGAQGEKNRLERLASKQTFFVKENFKVDRKSYRVLLLDDIYTTGRTLYHARDALKKVLPNAKISSFTLCR